MQLAVNRHAEADTPFGRDVQHMDLGIGAAWEYTHPFALAYCLFGNSAAFATFWNGTVQRACGKVRVLLHGDEFVPGNPNRVDRGGSLMSIEYTFIDFPT